MSRGIRRRIGMPSALLLALAGWACASSRPASRPPLPSPVSATEPVAGVPLVVSASDLLDRSRAAQDAGDYARADSILLHVWDACGGETPAGGRALLLLAGLRLDPRYGASSPAAAARAAARYLRTPGTPEWTRPLARQLYLLALEMGAPPLDADSVPEPGPASGSNTASGSDAAAAKRTDGTGDPAAAADTGTARSATPDVQPPLRAAALPVHACGVREPTRSAAAEPGLPEPGGETLSARLLRLQGQVAALQKELERIRKTIHP